MSVLEFEKQNLKICKTNHLNLLPNSTRLYHDKKLTVEKFIKQANNYGPFWLSVSGNTNKNTRIFQIVTASAN